MKKQLLNSETNCKLLQDVKWQLKKNNGFTLIEALISLAIIGVIGFMMVDILTKSYRGSNKTQLVGNIKQNGQSALNIMDQTIRNADAFICAGYFPQPSSSPAPSTNTSIVTLKDDKYTRFSFVAEPSPTSSPIPVNGYIVQDDVTSLIGTTVGSDVIDPADQSMLKKYLCDDSAGLLEPTYLTNTNPVSGVSLKRGSFSEINNPSGKSAVIIDFGLNTAARSPGVFDKQVLNDILFSTTIQIR